jgi:predicted DNA-binding protein (MmcQ/YjbR family)
VGGRVTRRGSASRARGELRRFALALPDAHEDFPWGESVVKVGKKVFLFLGRAGAELSLSVKLPLSNLLALDLPFATPTGYGLARGGWVTARFGAGKAPPLELLRQWVIESYRAVAPRRRVGELDARGSAGKKAPIARARASRRLGGRSGTRQVGRRRRAR